MNEHEKFMKAALKQAQISAKNNEVPIGAVVVKDGKIIARAHNTRNKTFFDFWQRLELGLSFRRWRPLSTLMIGVRSPKGNKRTTNLSEVLQKFRAVEKSIK